jgi:hypothetical protein
VALRLLSLWLHARSSLLATGSVTSPFDTSPPPPANWNAFVQGLREVGYIEGPNIAFEHRSAHGQPEVCPSWHSNSQASR